MKTKIVSLLGIALLALASCQGGGSSTPSSAPSSTLPSEGSSPVLPSTPEESSTPTSIGNSSSSPTSSSSSSESSSETPVTIDEEYIADLLNSYITGENFQVDYQGSGADGESIVDFHDYYTQDYIYISYADTYVIELPDYRDETKSLVYNLYHNEEDGFDLGIALLYGNGTPVTEVTDSYNHLYQTPLLSTKDFVETEEPGTFKTENGDLINNIASLFGENYSMTASLGIFTHILFTPLENGDLAFDLYGYDTYGMEILSTTTLYLSARLTHLRTTVYEPLADYLDFYRNTDKVTLQPNQVEDLTGDILTLLNTKKVCKEGETDGELYMTREITTSQDLYRIINTYAGGEPLENIYAKDEETGDTNSYNFYLDASNSPSFSGPVDMPFDSTFGMIQNVFKGDLSPFVSLDGGKHFNYIGVDPYGLNTSLTDEYSYPTRFELFVEDDKLDKITLTYPDHAQDEEGNILTTSPTSPSWTPSPSPCSSRFRKTRIRRPSRKPSTSSRRKPTKSPPSTSRITTTRISWRLTSQRTPSSAASTPRTTTRPPIRAIDSSITRSSPSRWEPTWWPRRRTSSKERFRTTSPSRPPRMSSPSMRTAPSS